MTPRPLLTVPVAELLRRPGTRRDERRSAVLAGLATSAAAVPEGEPVEVDVTLEAIAGGVVAAGTVAAPWVGECRRCLGEAAGVARADVREIFEARPTEGETYPLDGDVVDLEPMVRDAVLLALPLAPLCSAGCRGPAPDEVEVRTPEDPPGPDEPGADGSASGPGRGGDPRWAALDELRFE